MATVKEDFISGAVKNGCPAYEAQDIWHKIEVAGKYSFNRSHAAAYALTAYCGAWLKANYPTAFYTVALQWAEDKEIPLIMSEMEECSVAKIVPPDINKSEPEFYTDYSTDNIYWSLSRIKMLGTKSVEYIIEERQSGGPFISVRDFIERIFRKRICSKKGSKNTVKNPVTSLHVKNLILAGCFDKVEDVKDKNERYFILSTLYESLKLNETELSVYKGFFDVSHYWAILQIEVSGIGQIDYRRIYDNSQVKERIKGKATYMTIKDALDLDNEGKKIVVCATVVDFAEVSYTDKLSGERKQFCKLKLQQNNALIELVCWHEFYQEHKERLQQMKDKIVVLTSVIKYSDYSGCNTLGTFKNSLLHIV